LPEDSKRQPGIPRLSTFSIFVLEKPEHFLKQPVNPVDTITYAAGYGDVSSFRRLFKKTTGLTPTAYRKKFSLYA